MKTNYKKPNYLIFGSSLLFLLMLVNLATLVIVTLMFYKQIPLFGGDNNPKNPVNNVYAGCQLLSDACAAQDCQYYYYCSDFPGAKSCAVYDCGNNYGVAVQTKEGSLATKEYAKPDKEKVYALVDRCQGKLTVKDKKCIQNKYEIDVDVTTKGQCLIQGFMVDTGNKNYISSEFKPTDNSGYHLTLNSCADFSEIIAVGEGGVSIR